MTILNQIIELCKENKSMLTNNITNTNSHNKTINIINNK